MVNLARRPCQLDHGSRLETDNSPSAKCELTVACHPRKCDRVAVGLAGSENLSPVVPTLVAARELGSKGRGALAKHRPIWPQPAEQRRIFLKFNLGRRRISQEDTDPLWQYRPVSDLRPG